MFKLLGRGLVGGAAGEKLGGSFSMEVLEFPGGKG